LQGAERYGAAGPGAARLGKARLAAARPGMATNYTRRNIMAITPALNGLDAISNVSNDAKTMIDSTIPYVATVRIEGTCPILFHRWSNASVAEKSAAAKGSKAKKTDDVDSYVYRCPDNTIGIPGVYLVGCMTDPKNGAAKYQQDPRSPRKSALDLFRASVVPLTDVASLGSETWDYLDERRVTVQRNGITRVRPAFHAGWQAEFDISVLTPEYISPSLLLETLTLGGRLVGIADFRPTFGRFQITRFDIA
jgi:hypothetical protein